MMDSMLTTTASRSSISRSLDDLDINDLATQSFLDDTGAPATLPDVGAGGEDSKMRVLLGLLKK